MATRAQITAARQEIAAAKQQLLTSREQLLASKKQATDNLQTIKSEQSSMIRRKRVPFTPREERTARLRYKAELGTSEAEMLAAHRRLSEQERLIAEKEAEIAKYETEVLNPADYELTKIEEYNKAVDKINKFVAEGDEDKIHMQAMWGSGALKDAAEDYLRNKRFLEQSQTTTMYTDELGQGVSIAPELVSNTNYVPYEVPLQAYYDPSTGKEIFQSISPDIAKSLGYIPVTLKGYYKDTGASVVESPTGLLTPQQLAYKNLYEAVTNKYSETPKSFEFGGKQTKPDASQLLKPTSYQAAIMSSPYNINSQQFLVSERLKLGAKKFRDKYGYEITPSGEVLYSGSVDPLLITKGKGSYASAAGLTLGVFAPARAIAAGSVFTAGGLVFSDPISRGAMKVIDIIPQSKSIPIQLVRGFSIGASALIPGVGAAYGKELLTSFITNPIQTSKDTRQYLKEYPFELSTATFVGMGKSAQSIADYLTGARKRNIITTKGFPKLPRDITVRYLKNLENTKDYTPVQILTGSVVKEPVGVKVLSVESRVLLNNKFYKIENINNIEVIKFKGKNISVSNAIKRGGKLISSGRQEIAYGTPQIGEFTFAGGEVFVESASRNPVYWKNWFKQASKEGFIKTYRELGFPKPKYSNWMINEGDYIPKKASESVNEYYNRVQEYANKSGRVAVADAPKTVAGVAQPEFEVVYLYPKDQFGNVIVSRVRIGTDAFGRTIYREFPRKLSIKERINIKLSEKKLNYESYFKGIKDIAADLYELMSKKYGDIFVDKINWFEGKWDLSDKPHMTNVESNLKIINDRYKLNYSNNLIKSFARIHDILKLRGINITDESAVATAIKEGYLSKLSPLNKLTTNELKLLEEAVRYHHIANPSNRWNLQLSDFTKAAINADRLDITRYGKKVDYSRLFKIDKKYSGDKFPEEIIIEFNLKNYNKLSKNDLEKLRDNEYFLDYEYGNYIVKKRPVDTYYKYESTKYDSSNYVTAYNTYKIPKYSRGYKVASKYPNENYLVNKYPNKTRYTNENYLVNKYPNKTRYPNENYLVNKYPNKPNYPNYTKTTNYPIYPIEPKQINNLIVNREINKKSTSKKRKTTYETLPTLTQQLIGYKGKKAISQPKGFETIRIA